MVTFHTLQRMKRDNTRVYFTIMMKCGSFIMMNSIFNSREDDDDRKLLVLHDLIGIFIFFFYFCSQTF